MYRPGLVAAAENAKVVTDTEPDHPRVDRAASAAAAAHRFLVMLAFHAWLEHLAVTACGGDLPPCYVAERESKFDVLAVNPGHAGAPADPGDPWSHASGKWQFMPDTWAGFDGYPYAAAAPAGVQNDRARQVWAGGAGCGAWSAC